MVKKNDKCNILSDTFLKTLYNVVYASLKDRYGNGSSFRRQEDEEPNPKRVKLLQEEPKDMLSLGPVQRFMEKMCVSLPITSASPVQQTLMVGVPYRITDTLKCDNVPLLSNGEVVILTKINFNDDRSVSSVMVKPLKSKEIKLEDSKMLSDYFYTIEPGMTQNRLSADSGQQSSRPLFGNRKNSQSYLESHMFPMVPMVCENIYQMQGNTITSNCFVDLLSTKIDDVYVAVSRFQKAESINGIVFSG